LSDRADVPRDDAKCIEKLNRVWFRVVKSEAIPVACQVALPGIWFSVDSTCPIWALIRSFETIVAAISGEETLLAICTLQRTEECDSEGKVRKPDRQSQIP
jgi:hypothetical protein